MPTSSPSPPSIAAILAAKMEARPAREISPAMRKKISSAGFALTKLLASRPGALKQIEKRTELESLRRFLPQSPLPSHQPQNGLFASVMSCADEKLRITHAFLDPHFTTELANKLSAITNTLNDSAVSLPDDANAAIWNALLRLRPMRDYWERELRSNHHELLGEILPDAWLFDLTLPPPHAVIPRLEISHWSQLVQFHGSGRSFELAAAWETQPRWMLQANDSETAWKSALEEACNVGATAPLVLAEHAALPQTMIAFYQQKEKRVELSAAFAFYQAESGTMTVAQVGP